MFDNPKKELERLQAQLLAVEARDEEMDVSSDEIYDAFEDDLVEASEAGYEPFDQSVLHRSAGFDADIDPYEMDTDRYVPAPRKKGNGLLVFIAFLELLLAFALIAWWLGWLG